MSRSHIKGQNSGHYLTSVYGQKLAVWITLSYWTALAVTATRSWSKVNKGSSRAKSWRKWATSDQLTTQELFFKAVIGSQVFLMQELRNLPSTKCRCNRVCQAVAGFLHAQKQFIKIRPPLPPKECVRWGIRWSRLWLKTCKRENNGVTGWELWREQL